MREKWGTQSRREHRVAKLKFSRSGNAWKRSRRNHSKLCDLISRRNAQRAQEPKIYIQSSPRKRINKLGVFYDGPQGTCCKQKRNAANKKETLQTKKKRCKQKKNKGCKQKNARPEGKGICANAPLWAHSWFVQLPEPGVFFVEASEI